MNENETQIQSQVPRWITIVLIVSLLLNIAAFTRINSVMKEIKYLQSNIGSINNSIYSSIHSNMNTIHQNLKEQASIVADFTYEFGDYKDKSVDLLLRVKLKEYIKGDRIYFSYKMGDKNPALMETLTTDGVSFESKLNISTMEDVQLDLVIDRGEIRKTERLENLPRPLEKFTAQLSAQPQGGTMRYDKTKGGLILDFRFALVDMNMENSNYTLSDVKLSILVNGKEIMAEPMSKVDQYQHNLRLKNYLIPCKVGDSIDVYISAKDDKGFQYRALSESWKLETENDIRSGDKIVEMGKVEIR